MNKFRAFVGLVGYLFLSGCYAHWFTSNPQNHNEDKENCFCELKGKIDDCDCSFELIDKFNNGKIQPVLNSILQKDYFRYWKVNLNRGCPFWHDDSKCAMRYCTVEETTEVPESIKKTCLAPKYGKLKYMMKQTEKSCDQDTLGYLNTSISEASRKDFKKWAAYDDAQEDSFCYLEDENSADSQYVDLLLNPERFTGYAGPSAHRIWKSIYEENCFKPNTSEVMLEFTSDKGMCLEKRTFYRVVSGLHTSINIHLCAKYLLSDRDGLLASKEGKWGPNVAEFRKRFDPVLTKGHGLHRLKNLYFIYLLELRALAKVAPYLQNLEFYTGNSEEDLEMQSAVSNFLSVARSFEDQFDESSLFTGSHQAVKLKEEFRDHFRNISRIMDCVGCNKCMLWGKLQITGLGTALKILFSGKFDTPFPEDLTVFEARLLHFHLTRNEIVALFNAFGRLSSSIASLEFFRGML